MKTTRELGWKILRNTSGQSIGSFISNVLSFNELLTTSAFEKMLKIINVIKADNIPTTAAELLCALSPYLSYAEANN